jgi:hypothetical protein
MNCSTKNLILISSGGAEFELPVAAAALSELVLNACGRESAEDDGENESDSEEFPPVDVPRVSSDALAKIVDFLKHYKEETMKDIPTPLGGSTFVEVSLPECVHLVLDQACDTSA